MSELNFASLRRITDLELVFTIEREAALREEPVGNDATCPDVDFCIIGLIVHDLRRHIMRSADDVGQLRLDFFGIEVSGQTEVDDPQLTIFAASGQHHILEFKIAMSDTQLMHPADRVKQLPHDTFDGAFIVKRGRLLHRHLCKFNAVVIEIFVTDQLGERGALAVFEH